MEQAEGSRKRGSYEVVVKIRFDSIPSPPWSACNPSFLAASKAMARVRRVGPRLALLTTRSLLLQVRAVHAATDHTIWGPRELMGVVSRLWVSLPALFPPRERGAGRSNQSHSDVARLPVHTGAWLRTLLAQHPSAFDRTNWKHYNKVMTVPFVDMGVSLSSAGHSQRATAASKAQARVIGNAQAAVRAGWERVEPAAARHGARGKGPKLRLGLLAHAKVDYCGRSACPHGPAFVAEKAARHLPIKAARHFCSFPRPHPLPRRTGLAFVDALPQCDSL